MAVTVTELLENPLGGDLLARVIPDDPRQITRVTLLEDTHTADALQPGALVVLGRTAAGTVGGYRFDVLVRRAAEREVAALVLSSESARSATAEDLARRGRVSLLLASHDMEPTEALQRLGSAVSGAADATLARLALAAEHASNGGDDAETLLAELTALSGIQLSWDPTSEGVPVLVDGRPDGSVTTPVRGDASRVATYLAAAALSLARTAKQREAFEPFRSTSSAVNDLLICAQSNLAVVAERAERSGLHVHGWHCAARLTIHAQDEDALIGVDDSLMTFVAAQDRTAGDAWTMASPDDSILLVRTTRSDPGIRSDAVIRKWLDDLLANVISRHPELHLRVGIATPHQGPSGLRTSAEEARVALASAQLSEEAVSIATFDSLGVRRMVAEWLVTDSARDTVDGLLAPLDALGREKSRVAVETLHAYLDENGSWQRAAARLNLHRNAVVYRMSKISETLPNDLNDPDERFALQLACRGRLIATGRF